MRTFGGFIVSTATTAQQSPPAQQKSGRGTLYRGKPGMWSWVGHRITGVVICLFLLVHVLGTALVRVSPDASDAVIGTYKNCCIVLGESGLVAAVNYPACNGIRISLVDFWKKGTKYHKQMLWIVMIACVVVFGAVFVRHVMVLLGG